MLRMTWLATSRSVVLSSPKMPITITAGTMAISARDEPPQPRARRMLRKPSITIWPASVPVSVELWPAASSATANSDAGDADAEHGRRAAGSASWISATSPWPVPWNAAAARMRMAALMKQREHQREGRVERRELDRLALARGGLLVRSASARSRSAGRGCAASPSRRGCRSRRRASPVPEISGRWARSQPATPPQSGRAKNDLGRKAAADRRDQRDDHRLDLAEAPVLQAAARSARRAR